MTSQQILRYQLALLLTSSGRSRVLAALSELLKIREEELHAQLADLDQLEPKNAKKTKPSATQRTVDTLDNVVAKFPEKADALRILSARLINRTFLPELRDVRRFLADRSHFAKTLKSRPEALPKVLEVAAELNPDELKRLCEDSENGNHSSLGIISDEILGRQRR